jgi:cob(I)alamin adenosyltransferase
MKVYTRQETTLAEPESQKIARIESYGTVDELNSHIGLIRDQEMNAHYKEILIEIQDRLFTVGAILATHQKKRSRKTANCV